MSLSSVRFLFHAQRKKKRKNTKQSCCGYAILLTTVTVHEKLNTFFPFQGELFWKMTVHAL